MKSKAGFQNFYLYWQRHGAVLMLVLVEFLKSQRYMYMHIPIHMYIYVYIYILLLVLVENFSFLKVSAMVNLDSKCIEKLNFQNFYCIDPMLPCLRSWCSYCSKFSKVSSIVNLDNRFSSKLIFSECLPLWVSWCCARARVARTGRTSQKSACYRVAKTRRIP